MGTNPGLGPLQDNGGPTQTMAPLTGSAAVGVGDTTTCQAAPVNGVDQRGQSRPPTTATPTVTLTASATTTSNSIEDTFTRPNQTGWGTTTNNDGVSNVPWGMDGNGSLSYVSISKSTGLHGYPGTTSAAGIASAGGTAYNGGDSLPEAPTSNG